MIKFYWNGIKDNGGKIQTCHYSSGQITNYPSGTITIYARGYKAFSDGIQAAFKVDNHSDYQSDFVVTDHIRVKPDHPLYGVVFAAQQAQSKHFADVMAKRVSKNKAYSASLQVQP